MRHIIINHAIALIVALCVGVIYFLPNGIVRYARVSGITLEKPLNLEEVFSYGVAVKEIMDGRFSDGDPYLFEYKSTAGTWDYYPLSFIPGAVGLLLGARSPEPLFEWLDFFLPPISFLIIYALILRATRHKGWSAFAAFMVIAFPNIAVITQFFSSATWGAGFSGIMHVFVRWFNSDFSRLFVPSLTTIFFAAFLYLSYAHLRDKARAATTLIFGISFGALFYVYFYYWVYATIFLGVIIALLFIFYRSRLLPTIYAFLIGAAISIPHWIEFIHLRAQPHYGTYIERVGIAYSHALRAGSFDFFVLACALIALMWMLRARMKQFSLWGSAALTSSLVALNLQVLIGFNPQPDHWGSRVNAYVMMVVGLTVAAHLCGYLQRRWVWVRNVRAPVLTGVVLVFFLGVGFLSQSAYALSSLNDFGPSREVRAAFTWVNVHTPKDAVFVTPSYHAHILIPYFTHANVYLPMACLTRASTEEVLNRYLETYAFFGIQPDLFLESFQTNIEGVLESNFSAFCDTHNASHRGAQPMGGYREVPDAVVERLMAIYRNLVASRESTPLRSRADYVWWGPEERSVSTIDPYSLPNLKEVYRNSEVAIFSIEKNST